MDLSRVIFVMANLFSLTSIAGFIYEPDITILFIALSCNIAATILKLGSKSALATEILASSFVADLHIIPSYIYIQVYDNIITSIAFAIGALIANIITVLFMFIELNNQYKK